MSGDRARRVRDLFSEALERDRDSWSAYLVDECPDDEALREEVASLLQAHAAMGTFLQTPAEERVEATEPTTASRLDPGEEIGPYRIVRVLGAGGTGTVYEAEQASPRRRVALKVMRAGLDSESALRRFRDEAEILARLHHPGVAHVYEAGVREVAGAHRPFFALEYVEDARTALTYADAERLEAAGRLALAARIADAIQHGHEKGIVHRDVKPGNVLVDEAGRPKVIDFGIARALDAEDRGRRDLVGTLPYMSPERFDTEGGGADVRSDVYALGVFTYELLTGRLPIDVEGAAITEAARIIREVEPTRITDHDPRMRGDVEAIVHRALAKDREARYPSAAAFADDLRRHLAHRPVEAVRAGPLYALGKFARRQRLAFAAIVGVVLVSVAAALVSGWFALENARERRIAEAEGRRAEFQAYVANLAAAAAALRVYDVTEAVSRLRQAPPELRNWEWSYLVSRLDRSTLTLRGPENAGVAVALGCDGRVVLSVRTAVDERANYITIWDTATEEEVRRVGPLPHDVRSPVLGPDGRWLAWGTAKGEILLADLESEGDPVVVGEHGGEITRVAFSPDGRLLATASGDGVVGVWEVRTRWWRYAFGDGDTPFRDVAFSPDGARLAAARTAPESDVLLWNLRDGRLVRTFEGHEESVLDVDLGPDGTRLVSASADGTIRIWDTATGRTLHTLASRDTPAGTVRFGPEGRRVLSGHLDGTLTLWDAGSGAEKNTFWGHGSGATTEITYVAFGRDPSTVVSAARDAVKVWETGSPRRGAVLARFSQLVREVAYSPDGRWIACACFDGTARVFDLATGEEVAKLDDHRQVVMSVVFGPDGERLATGANDRSVKIWEVGSWACIATFHEHYGGVNTVAFSPDGRHVAYSTTDHAVILRSLDSGEVVWTWPQGGWVSSVVFNPDGSQLAATTHDGMLRIRDLTSGGSVREIWAGDGPVTCGVYGPGGRWFATSSALGEVRLWDLRTGADRMLRSNLGHGHRLTFSPDGTRLLGTAASKLRVWDVATGEPVLDLRAHEVMTWAVAIHPDGTQIATGGGWWHGEDCSVRLWGRTTGRPWPPRLPEER